MSSVMLCRIGATECCVVCKHRYCLPAGEVVWVRSIVKKYHNLVSPWLRNAQAMLAHKPEGGEAGWKQ
jgi:hypothetical protein